MLLKICYFGAYRLDLCRNTIYIKGLRKNAVEVVECFDHSSGLVKYFKLFVKHRKIRNSYDVMIVGYPGALMAIFAKLISRKPVIFNALSSLYEVNIVSRARRSKYSFLAWRIWLVDWLAFKFSDLVLVETNKQKEYLIKKFRIKPEKFTILFTGADDADFFPDPKIKKNNQFSVLFRGKFLPEAGIKHIVDTAKLLENQGVKFLLIGGGTASFEREIKQQIKKLNLKNLKLIIPRLGIDEMREKMLTADVSIGQVENHERLERTIPYKAFESLASKLPYVTGNAEGIKELLQDRENCLMVNLADPRDLAEKILELKNNPELREKIAENGYKLYKRKLTPKVLGLLLKNKILDIID